MSNNLKITLAVVISVISAMLLFALIVIIGCSVNGLTFGEQICSWFGSAPTIPEDVEQATETIVNTLQIM